MRHVPAVALAALLALSPLAARAEQPAAGATPPASELAPPPDAMPADPDAPPPFMVRPKLPATPARQDLTFAKSQTPAEFRGLAWGTPLGQAQARFGLKPVTSPRPLRDTYFRPDESLTLGDAQLVTVAYYFRGGKFAGAGIVLSGEANYFLVKDYLIERYGLGHQVGDHYGWTWDHVNIDMHLRDGMGEVRYTFEP